MTKTAEIDLYRRFVADLPPASYLRDILGDSVEWVAEQIRCDLAFPDTLPRILANRREEEERLGETRQKLREAQQQLRQTEAQLDRARDALADIKATAEHLAARCRA